jgi:hypothetical protein
MPTRVVCVASLKYQTTLNLRAAAADVDPASNLSEPTCCGIEALDSAMVKVNAVKAISLFALENGFIVPPKFVVLWRYIFRPDE